MQQQQQWYIKLFPEQASTMALQVDLLYFYLVAITVFFTGLIVLAIIFFAVKYREREKFATPERIEGSLKLETLWSVIPFLISMSIFAWGAYLFVQLYRRPTDAMEFFAVGKQWMWKFQHPTGQREINDLHIPKGRRIKFTMTTEDVLHDLYFPAFRTKADVVPGRYTYLWFEATQVGKFPIYCAEYCGLNHSGMVGSVYVMEPAEYEKWLMGNAGLPPAEAGKQLFTTTYGCASCHSVDGTTGGQYRGPTMKEVFGKEVEMSDGTKKLADENYIRRSIENPQAELVKGYGAIMPTFKGQINPDQMNQLIAYIKTLSSAGTTTTGGTSQNSNTANTNSSPTNTNKATAPSNNNQRPRSR
jgi:cytochrome c oxidase subunit 2